MPSSDDAPSTTAIALATAILSLAAGYFLGTASSLSIFSSSTSSTSPRAKTSKSKKEKSSWPNSYDVTIHPDSSDEDLMARLKANGSTQAASARGPNPNPKLNARREVPDSDASSTSASDDEEEGLRGSGDLKTFTDNKEDTKLVLVVRSDLGMGKGKIAAQCSHATLAVYKTLLSSPPNPSSPGTTHPLLKRWESTGQAKIATQVGTEDELLVLQATAQSLGLCAKVVHDAGRTQVASGTATVLGVGPGPKGVVDQVTGGLKLL